MLKLLVPVVIDETTTMPSTGKATPLIGALQDCEIVLDADIDRRVVHIVLNAVAIDSLEFPDVFLAELQVRGQDQAPPTGVPLRSSVGSCWCRPTDLPDDACQSARNPNFEPAGLPR